jgi:hypothetical protein
MTRPTKADLKTSILNLLAERRDVTFAEVMRLPGAEGNYVVEPVPGVWLWAGLSHAAASAINELCGEKAISFRKTTKLPYVVAGAWLALPLANPRRVLKGYKEPRWHPVLINAAKVAA